MQGVGMLLGVYFWCSRPVALHQLYLEERYGSGVRALTTGVFIVAYMFILLPFVLYSAAAALCSMLDLPDALGASPTATIWMIVGFVAIVGSAYAIFCGLRAVAISDTFNGIGLLIGGSLSTCVALKYATVGGHRRR